MSTNTDLMPPGANIDDAAWLHGEVGERGKDEGWSKRPLLHPSIPADFIASVPDNKTNKSSSLTRNQQWIFDQRCKPVPFPNILVADRKGL